MHKMLVWLMHYSRSRVPCCNYRYRTATYRKSPFGYAFQRTALSRCLQATPSSDSTMIPLAQSQRPSARDVVFSRRTLDVCPSITSAWRHRVSWARRTERVRRSSTGRTLSRITTNWRALKKALDHCRRNQRSNRSLKVRCWFNTKKAARKRK